MRVGHGSTPLHCAAAGNHPDVVTYLIVDAGCDKNKVRTSIKQIVDIDIMIMEFV